MDDATREGVTGIDPGDTGFSLVYRRAGETTDTPLTLTAVAAGAAIAANQWREYGDGAYSVVGPAGMYASGARFVKIRADCTTPAALADVVFVALSGDDPLSAGSTPTAVSTQVLGDLAGTPGNAARTAIAGSVDAAVADNFSALATAVAAVPGATETALADNISAVPAATAAAVRDELLSVRWGLQTIPPGGSEQVLTIVDTPSGTVLGVVRRRFDADGVLRGQTEMTAS